MDKNPEWNYFVDTVKRTANTSFLTYLYPSVSTILLLTLDYCSRGFVEYLALLTTRYGYTCIYL